MRKYISVKPVVTNGSAVSETSFAAILEDNLISERDNSDEAILQTEQNRSSNIALRRSSEQSFIIEA